MTIELDMNLNETPDYILGTDDNGVEWHTEVDLINE